MKSTWKENLWTAFLVILILLVIIGGAVYEYVRFMAYWKVAFGG